MRPQGLIKVCMIEQDILDAALDGGGVQRLGAHHAVRIQGPHDGVQPTAVICTDSARICRSYT